MKPPHRAIETFYLPTHVEGWHLVSQGDINYVRARGQNSFSGRCRRLNTRSFVDRCFCMALFFLTDLHLSEGSFCSSPTHVSNLISS